MKEIVNPYFKALDAKIATFESQKHNSTTTQVSPKNNLFIIGNGFDLYHDADTSYDSYKKYLTKNFHLLVDVFDSVYNWVDKSKIAQFTQPLQESIFDNSWNNLEFVLGNENIPIDYSGLFDNQINVGLWSYLFTHLVSFWIKEIVTSERFLHIKRKPNLLFPTNSLYLNFNYTPTLETVYGISHNAINYIHGFYTDERLLFGHSDQQAILETKGNLQNFYKNSFKDIPRNIQKNHKYFESLKSYSINHIWILGHSLADVDYLYFEKINSFFPKAHWTIAYYDNTAAEKIKKTKTYQKINSKELKQWSEIDFSNDDHGKINTFSIEKHSPKIESDPILDSLKEIKDLGDDFMDDKKT